MGTYELYSMAVMALNLSAGSNGVAKLHGEVSRNMWQWVYPNVPEHEVPVDSVTNGIHVQTWVSREMATLLDRYLDPAWRSEEERAEIWEKLTPYRMRNCGVPMNGGVNDWWPSPVCDLRTQLENRGAALSEIEAADEVLNPDALTIGFARRFRHLQAGYAAVPQP